MKKIFICSPYRGDIKANTKKAKNYVLLTVACGYVPIVPHLYFPQFLNDDQTHERMKGILLGTELMKVCDEFWLMGCDITKGMEFELEKAKENKIPVALYDEDFNRISRKTILLDDRVDDRYRELIQGHRFVR